MFSAMRQDYREEVPKILAEKFSRKPTDEEWSAMHLVFGKTDSGVLRDNYAGAELRKLLTDKTHLAAEIKQREEELKVTSKAWAIYQRKAKELARYMVTGEVRNNYLLRNANAITALLGEAGKGTDDTGTIELIDILTTLYALNEVDQAQMDLVSKLADTEADGIDFLAGYLWSVAKDEKAKVVIGEAAWFNHYKGYIPSERRDGIDLIVRDDSEHNTLVARGYTRMGDYKGAGVESGKKGYYFSTVAGNGIYTQGAMQTIQQSASGVDPRTGRTISGTTAGVIHGKYLSLIKQRLQNTQRGPEEALLPIYAKGVVVAYERHMAPHALAALERNTHMGEMLGAWAGRQAEEELAQQYNRMLVDNLKTIWDRDKAKRADEFVDITDVFRRAILTP